MEDFKITFSNFNRRIYMKKMKRRFEQSIIFCKLRITNKDKESIENHKKITDLTNSYFLKVETFQNELIYFIINELELYNQFLFDFQESIKNTREIDALKDRHKTFIDRQQELIIFLQNPIKKITEYERNQKTKK